MSMLPVDYSQLRFLVVDDQEASRKTLRLCAQTMGAFSVAFSEGYADAIFRIRNAVPDIILCDYVLGDGRSGQQLLEELRRFDLVSDQCVFIMVTAEQSYEQVVSAVELIPDDYILKPFSPDLLHVRLDRALAKKLFLAPYFREKRAKRFDQARTTLHELARDKAARDYRIDLMRAEAELLVEMRRGTEAEAKYRDILDIYHFPWANAGMTRALMLQQRVEEAREVVDTLVAEAPLYLGAYDLKAEVCTAQGDYREARVALEAASAKSPRNYVRKRIFAAVALASGDTKAARAAMQEVLANDSLPGAVKIDDHLALARAGLDDKDHEAAAQSLKAAAAYDTMAWPERVSFTALAAVVNPEGNRGPFLAMRDRWLREDMPLGCHVDVVRACLVLGETELADEMTRKLMAHENVRAVFRPAFVLYRQHGREDVFREIQKEVALTRIHATPMTPSAEGEESAPADDGGIQFL